MARVLQAEPRYDTSQYQPTEVEILTPAQALQLKGMDRELPVNLLDPGVARLVRNLCIRRGAYESRDIISVVGLVQAPSSLIYVLDLGISPTDFSLTRFYTTGVQVQVLGSWAPSTGDPFTGLVDSPFAFSGWGSTLMFRAGIGKIFSLDYGTNNITEIADAPTGAINLATFGTRALAVLDTNQINWSVRGNNTDWSGIGSGYEDLKSAPGGRTDKAIAVIPISDETAFHVRTNSIWQISLTGDVDAPFAFNRLYEFIGGRYPQLCTAITRGLICVDDQHIWMVTPQTVKDIALPILSYLTAAQPYMATATATYDPVWREYRIVLPGATYREQRVLRYNELQDAWTEDIHSFNIRSISYTLFTTFVPPTTRPGMVYASGRDVIKDVPNTEPTRLDGFRVETGDIRKTDSSTRKELVEIVLWYEATAGMTIFFEYSSDGGQTWLALSELYVDAATRPTPVSITKTIDRDYIQIAAYTQVCPATRLIKLEAWMREAGKITDAH